VFTTVEYRNAILNDTAKYFFFVWVLKRNVFDIGAGMFVRKEYVEQWCCVWCLLSARAEQQPAVSLLVRATINGGV
jgi:hypothetical protein